VRITLDIRASRRQLTAALQGLVLVDAVQLADGAFPTLYDSGVRYEREVGRECWQTIEQVYQAGVGDCEDLAAWRAAELLRDGVVCRAEVIRTGPRLWHAIVRFPDNTIEDPARILGMGRRRRA
jgi:hypothetical protein